MTDTSRPRLSVGVPVYNGQRFLRATIDSILGQTFRDLEVIVCDNASTDSTESIAREYAARDPRVRYYRNDRNIGPAPNYNRCVDLARGEFFKWNAADDVIAPTFAEKCIAELDRDPSLVGAFTRTREIDADGRELHEHKVEPDLAAATPSQRLRNLVFLSHRHHAAPELFGIFRTAVLRSWSPTNGSFPSADRLVITRIALHGPIARVPEFLFFNRDHGNRSVKWLQREKIRPGSRLARRIGCGPVPSYEWWDATKKGRIVFPEWRWLSEYFKAVNEAPMPAAERMRCWGVLALLTITFVPRLTRDALIAAEQAFNRVTGLSPKPPEPASKPELSNANPAPRG